MVERDLRHYSFAGNAHLRGTSAGTGPKTAINSVCGVNSAPVSAGHLVS